MTTICQCHSDSLPPEVADRRRTCEHDLDPSRSNAMTTADASIRSPLDAARRLAPSIRQRAEEIEETRELPRAVFEALADAGLFQMLVPRSLGGQELDLPTYVRVIEELGKADASTAWAIN